MASVSGQIAALSCRARKGGEQCSGILARPQSEPAERPSSIPQLQNGSLRALQFRDLKLEVIEDTEATSTVFFCEFSVFSNIGERLKKNVLID